MSLPQVIQVTQTAKASLPLPEPCETVKAEPELLEMWQAINEWWKFIKEAGDNTPAKEDFEYSKNERKKRRQQRGLPVREYGPSIQLACKVTHHRLNVFVNERLELVAEHLAMEQLSMASKKVGEFPQVKELYQWGPTSSLTLTFGRAEKLLKSSAPNWNSKLFPVEKQLMPIERLKECIRVWRLILAASESLRDEKVITVKETRRILKFLDKLKAVRTGDASQEAAVREGLGLSTVRDAPLEMLFSGSPPPASFSELAELRDRHIESALARRRTLAMSQSKCLAFVDSSVCGAPMVGPAGCRARPRAKDIIALVDGEKISDLIIDAYLSLVCHYGNGHLPDTAARGQMERSPRWHAWSTDIGRSLVNNGKMPGAKGIWPPPLYPNARLGEVERHIFPVLLERNHWVMAILVKEGGSYSLGFHTSIRESRYAEKFQKLWNHVEQWMSGNGLTDPNFRGLTCEMPPQPQQQNEMDCGIFILFECRWVMEQKPWSTILMPDIRQIRRQMAVELENWSLL